MRIGTSGDARLQIVDGGSQADGNGLCLGRRQRFLAEHLRDGFHFVRSDHPVALLLQDGGNPLGHRIKLRRRERCHIKCLGQLCARGDTDCNFWLVVGIEVVNQKVDALGGSDESRQDEGVGGPHRIGAFSKLCKSLNEFDSKVAAEVWAHRRLPNLVNQLGSDSHHACGIGFGKSIDLLGDEVRHGLSLLCGERLLHVHELRRDGVGLRQDWRRGSDQRERSDNCCDACGG